ncbi:MAG: SDR family NAD(P)-dependent oxidoreductase [Candidatus Omnitrophica bacterium]|nr:SDR family NAD(P)-dependent oxidoreductase [Candidatus Omnitrophota bacterium]
MQIDFKNKIILVTGGSGTLGSCLVEEALSEGAEVFFTYACNEKQARVLEKKGAHPYRVDFLSREGIKKFIEELKTQIKHLDVLVNNAVAVSDRTVINLTIDEWDRVLGVGLHGIFYLTKQLLPFLFKSAQGKIINIVSQVGLHGGFGQANYAAAKGGLIAFTKSLAKELGRKNILVNAVNPGFMISDITREIPERVFKENKKKSSLGAYSDPRDAARFVLYLASDYVRTVSGQMFNFDSRVF